MYCCCDVYLYTSEEATQRAGDVRVKLEPLSLAINSITESGVATRCMLARRGQSRVQYTPRKRPWRTNSRGATRRLMFKYVHWHYALLTCNCKYLRHCYICYLSTISNSRLRAYKSVTVTLTDVYFSQVKNKPWHPWVYTWFWHRREQSLLFVFHFLLLCTCFSLFKLLLVSN